MNFYKAMLKTARGNIPRMEDPFDPYKRQQPGQLNNGLDYRVRLGDEEGGSASMGGTRVRGKDFPMGISQQFDDDYDLQRKRSIPEVTHTMTSNDPKHQDVTMHGSQQGVDSTGENQTFTDDRDKITPDSMTWKNDPVGPAQMQGNQSWKVKNNPYAKTRDKLKGAYK